MGLIDNALWGLGNLLTGDTKDAQKYFAETARVASGQAKTVQNTAEAVAHSIVEKPLASAQVAVGGVLVATGVGAAAGVALIAKGGVDLAAQAVQNAGSALDSPKTRTLASVELEVQRKTASAGVNAAQNRPSPVKSPVPVVRVEEPPPPPVPPPPPPDLSFGAFLRDFFGGGR